jgi:hypothetical protein
MPEYLLTMYYPEDEDKRRRAGLPPGEMAEEGKRWGAFNEEIQKAGVVISQSGLQGVDAATTVRVRDGETEITDGPFAETKDLLAGYWHIKVDDLDEALKWAARIPAATHGCVEVRPTWGA